MTSAERDAIWRGVEHIYRSGAQPAVALCLRRNGLVVIDRAIGHARGNGPDDTPITPKRPATPDTLFCMFSASKAVTAMVIHLLHQHGDLHIDHAVADYIPAFSQHGKGTITIRDLLTHRAGIPTVPGSHRDPDMLLSPARSMDALCNAKPNASRRVAYHALSAGYVLGEVAKRATGMDLRQNIRKKILDPLGFDAMSYGVAEDRFDDVALNYDTGIPIPFPASRIARRALGVTWSQATALSNDPRFYREIIPSANIMTTANEASRFYQLLLQEGELDGVRIYDPETIRRARTGNGRLVIDGMLLAPVRHGAGLLLGDRFISPYGPDTRQAFGHPGYLGILCWADPERRLSVALMNTGKTILDAQWRAFVSLLMAIGRLSKSGAE